LATGIFTKIIFGMKITGHVVVLRNPTIIGCGLARSIAEPDFLSYGAGIGLVEMPRPTSVCRDLHGPIRAGPYKPLDAKGYLSMDI